jgi:hypothetical protein
MKKAIIEIDEAHNLLEMLKSTDEENHTIAFLAIENCNIKDSIILLYIIYKFSDIDPGLWKDKCPELLKELINKNLIDVLPDDAFQAPTMNAVFNRVIKADASKEIMAFFLDLHNKYMLSIMKAWGYPTEQFEINIKLR